MIVPYRNFLYQFPDFVPNISVTAIRKQFPEGDMRTLAFLRAKDQLTDRADLAYEYINCRVRDALYSVEEYDECLQLVKEALKRPPRGKSHDKLTKLQNRLLLDREQWIDDVGIDEPEEGKHFVSDVEKLLHSGQIDEAIERSGFIRANTRPRGVIYSHDEDQVQLWCAFHYLAKYYFDHEMPEKAIPLMDECCDKCIEARLTPIPGFKLQEQIIGYLAQVDISAAQRTLRIWIENSRMPLVSDAIKHHPDFQDICDTTQYVERTA